MSPLRSAAPYIAGLLFTIGITVFCHFQALEISGTKGLEKADEDASDAKAKLFNHFIALIGDNGVWAIGIVISTYILYRIYKRYTNPPDRVKFLPQNEG